MFSLPDDMKDRVTDYTPAYFAEKGIKTLFLDVDNTLVPYDEATAPELIRSWMTAISESGVRVFLISNNHPPRVETFAEGLPCGYMADAGKPLTRKLRAFAEEQGIDLRTAAAVGDQIFTDVWAAHLLGIPCFVVPSIKPVNTPFFRFKRALERPFFALYRRKSSHKLT